MGTAGEASSGELFASGAEIASSIAGKSSPCASTSGMERIARSRISRFSLAPVIPCLAMLTTSEQLRNATALKEPDQPGGAS